MAQNNNTIKYENGKVYKIVCNITGDIYIGSTTKKYLSQRLTAHKASYNQYLKKMENFTTSFTILERGNYDIVLIENVICTNKDELKSRERYHIENNVCVNKCLPGRTKKEGTKAWYEKNNEKINEKKRTKFKCECGGQYTHNHKAQHLKSKIHNDYISKSI
jgi:hypothetical protein